MYDHSYNGKTLGRMLLKSDFDGVSKGSEEVFKNAKINAAIQSAASIFNGLNPISAFHLKKKTAYRIDKLEDALVVRKLGANLKMMLSKQGSGRAFIVANLALLIEEGLPYRLYRLDVKSFYESFDVPDILANMATFPQLNPRSQHILTALLNHYVTIGGKGVPRGLAISATLSDLMMVQFDKDIFAHPAVNFYARYVDDIIIISNALEDKGAFIRAIEQKLPTGLLLNETKKSIVTARDRVKQVTTPITPILCLDYLGYQLVVSEPIKSKDNPIFRNITVNIANTKIKKIKARIIRSFIDFHKNGDWHLLLNRIKYLTSNFSIFDVDKGNRKLAGIFHSYPQVSNESSSLQELDHFLRNAVLAKVGRVFSKTSPMLSAFQKRTLLSQSFKNGHSRRIFIYFSPINISEIQRCWINE